MQLHEDDVDCFRRIHVHNTTSPIESIKEAHELLLNEPNNAKALQFIAWHNFPHADTITTSADIELFKMNISSLESALLSGMITIYWHLNFIG